MINFKLNNSVFVLVMTVCSRFLILVVVVGIVAFDRVYGFRNWRSRLELQLARQKLGADWIILELATT